MSYAPVEADDRLEEGQPELEFKNFDDLPAPRRDGGGSRPGYISDAPSNASPWALEYYQPLFAVSTRTVLTRCLTTLNPFSPSYTTEHISPQPDLYGPFWTLTTLIFALFVTSSLASSVASYLSDPGKEIDYDFELLSVAVGVVYAYGLVVPAALWGVLRWWGVVGSGGEGWGLVEAWACWGYAMFVWIPVSILCVIPVAIVRWVLVGVAFGISGYFLVANVYPILASADHKYARLLIVLVAVLHAALALVFKLEFFAYYVVRDIGPKDPTGETPALFRL